MNDALSGGDQEPFPDRVGNRRAMKGTVRVALALSAIFTALCLQWSLSHGRLAQDSTYDDCAYLYDGGSRLMIFYEGGFGAFLTDAVRNPPHAPFSTYGATLAFALFGVHDWAPYVMNGWIVCGLLLLVGYLARALPLRWRIALMAMPLTLPIAVSTVHDYRPDAMCSLLSLTGMYLVVEAGVYRTGRARKRALVLGGIAFGLALWAKPPVFALTLVTAAFASASAWLAARRFDPERREQGALGSAWRIGAAVALPCALVAAPYYAVNGVEVVRYFLVGSFSQSTAFWKLPGGWSGAARFYIFGEAGELLMGRGFYAWGTLYVLALGWIAWRREKRELFLQGALLLLTVVSLAAVVYGGIQNPFFGMTWVMLLTATCLRAWAFVLAEVGSAGWERFAAAALLVALGITDLSLLRLHKCWPHDHPAVNELVGRGHSINERIIDDISRELARRGGNPAALPTVFLTVTGFINEATLRWLAFRDGRSMAFSDLQFESHIEPFRQRIATADFIVSGEDKTGGVYEILPPWKLRFQLADLVTAEAHAGRLRELASYPTSEGGSYRLFVNEEKLTRKSGAFSAFASWEGFLPFEGPYPQWQLGRVRWAVGSVSRFEFDAAMPGPGRLDMWFRAQHPVHASIVLNETPIRTMEVSESSEFQHLDLPVTLLTGRNRFAISFSDQEPPDPDGVHRELLFSQLEVRPALP